MDFTHANKLKKDFFPTLGEVEEMEQCMEIYLSQIASEHEIAKMQGWCTLLGFLDDFPFCYLHLAPLAIEKSIFFIFLLLKKPKTYCCFKPRLYTAGSKWCRLIVSRKRWGGVQTHN